MPEIRITGLRKLSAELKKLSKDLPKELKSVSKDAAEIVAVEARTIVPVRTGALRGAIKSAAVVDGGRVRVGGLPYAKPIHFGWRAHNIVPNPFIYDALDNRRGEVIAKFEKDTAALIERTVKDGGGD